MRRVFLIALAVVALAIVVLAGHWMRVWAAIDHPAASDEKRDLVVDGVTRHYLLHVPAGLHPGRRAPLVLVFHGGGGHAANMPGFTHFDDLADKELFLVAYPDGVNHHWNDGRAGSTADDVAFIRALLDELERSYPIDAHRIFATGISNGGFFSNRLACEMTDRLAAFASVAATLPEPLAPACKPSRPISVLYIQGVNDPLVPIDGGKIGFRRGRSLGTCLSLAESAKFWRANDGISAPPISDDLPDRVNDGTHVRRQIWAGGKNDTEVVVYTIDGGGHAWPGGPQYLPKFIVGTASQNLNATRTIWDFFKRQSLNP